MELVLNSVVPQFVKDGVFGRVEYVGFTNDKGMDIGPHFASSLAFIRLRVKGSSGEEELPMVIKFQTDNVWKLENTNTKIEFRNEISMYTEVLPVLGYPSEYLPKYYYGYVAEEGFDKDVLILEDMRDKGFSSSKLKIFLDFDHISLALKKIAFLHSKSYILKHENKKKFFELAEIGKYQALMLIDENILVEIQRGTKGFETKYGRDENIDKFLEIIRAGVTLETIIAAEEPFGVICHGDFCNNNVIYRYDNKDRPIECAIIDFQKSLYASPVTDLSFFLYLSTTSEIREKYWDDFLKIYWEHLREYVPEHIQLPPFEDFLVHFSTRAVHGYIICSFFLPILLSKDGWDFEALANGTGEELDDLERTKEEEEINDKIKDAFHHVWQKNYIKSFVDYVTKLKM